MTTQDSDKCSKDAIVGCASSTTSCSNGAVVIGDAATRDFFGACVSDRYRMKSELVSKALSEIGMGKYQWGLFVVTGFGWMADNMMTQGLSAALTPIALEFNTGRVSYATVAYFIGLTIGASFWGITSDIIGRRPAFNITLFISAIFCVAAAGAPNFITFSALWALAGVGTGGNVPVDALIFLEFLPASHQWLLTVLASLWCSGQVITSLVAWVFLAKFSCAVDVKKGMCRKEDNMGWRYMLIVIGALVLVFALVRMFVFRIPESPRYLLSVGRDKDAIEAINFVARRNGKPEPLTLADLEAVDRELGLVVESGEEKPHLSASERVKESLSEYKGGHIKALFATKKMGFHCTVLWAIWATIGIGAPLYFNFVPSYLATRFTTNNSLDDTYKKYCIVSTVGLTGPIMSGFLINTRLGRKWVMAVSFIISGVFLFLYTTAKSEAADLGFQCATAVLGNFSYAILYGYTPESLPAPHRGTGNGIASCIVRFCGVFAPIISANTGFTAVPLYASAGLWCLAGLLTCLLPFETYGHAAI